MTDEILTVGPAEQLKDNTEPLVVGAPENLDANLPQAGPAVDPLSEDAPIEAFKEWEKTNQSPGIWEIVKPTFRGMGLAGYEVGRTAAEDGVTQYPGIPVPIPGKRGRAMWSDVAAEAYKGFATIGEVVKEKVSELGAGEAKVGKSPEDAQAIEDQQARVRRRTMRTLVDLNRSANDGRVLLSNALTMLGDPSNEPLTHDIDEEGVRMLSNFVDPDILSAMGVRSLKQLLTPLTGQFKNKADSLIMAVNRHAEAFELVETTRAAGGNVTPEMLKDLAEAEAKRTQANEVFQSMLGEQKAAQAALKPAEMRAAGAVVSGAGTATRKVGEGIDWLQNLFTNAEKAVGDETAGFRDLTLAGIAKLTHVAPEPVRDLFTQSLPRTLKGVGEFGEAAGEQIGMMENSLPYFQRLKRALPEESFGRGLAANMERVEFLADSGRWLFETGADTAKSGAIGAGFGYLSGDTEAGFAQGMVFGMTGSQFGQFIRYNSKEQVATQQQGDVYLARNRPHRKGDAEFQRKFDLLSPGEQVAFATIEQAYPDVAVFLHDEPGFRGQGYYDTKGRYGEIHLSLKVPDIRPVMQHEFKHHLERHPELKQAVVTQMLGDPNTGNPGFFTALDASGKPIVITENMADGTVRRRFQTNTEFEQLKSEYLHKLEKSGINLGDYADDPEKIATELWAESENVNLFHRQPNGKFDILAAQQTNPLQRKLADFTQNSKLVRNSAFLQRALAKMGVVFDPFSGKAANAGLFSKSPHFNVGQILRQYAEANDHERRVADSGDDTRDIRLYTEEEILRSPELQGLFDAGFDVDKDPTTGKIRFLTESEARKRAEEFRETLIKGLDAYTGNEPDRVRKVEEIYTDSGGKEHKREVWRGRFIPESVIAEMEASGKFNSKQLQNLRNIGQLLMEGKGTEAAMMYQPAMNRGGKTYRSRPITQRVETPMSIQITRDANVVINTISQEKVVRNIIDAIKRGEMKPWNNDFSSIKADVDKYLENHASGLPGDANGLGTEKRDHIDAMFGQLTLEQRAANPVLGAMSEKKARKIGVVQSRRLDRINRMDVLSSTFKPDYSKVSRNYAPSADAATRKRAADAFDALVTKPGWFYVGGPFFSRQVGDGYVSLEFSPFTGQNEWRLGYIKTSETLNSRGKGLASKVLKEITDAADAAGVNVSLTVQPTKGEKGLNKKQLFDWYGRNGFERQPYYAQPDKLSENMIRKPKEQAPSDRQHAPDTETTLPHAVGGKLDVVHYSDNGDLTEIHPKFFGKSGATSKSEMSGLDRTYWLQKDGPHEEWIKDRAHRYETSIDGGRIYDGDKDPLGYYKQVNREARDQMLIDEGYLGIRTTAKDGRKQIEMFEPQPVDRVYAPEANDPGYVDTDTPEFKRWFGKSKASVGPGKPLLLYRGSPGKARLTKFPDVSQTTHGGFFFTDNMAEAEWYSRGGTDKGKLGRVEEVYLKMENPMEVDLGGVLDYGPDFDMAGAIADAKAAGHDGLIVHNAYNGHEASAGFLGVGDANETQYVVFEPGQIKSATDNNGQFDPTNPDIRYAPAPRVGSKEFKEWFGDGELVDKNGNPRVLYHGTAATWIDVFKSDRFMGLRGVAGHFAFDPDMASDFAMDRHDTAAEAGLDEEWGARGVVYPVYISAKKLFDARKESHQKAVGGSKIRPEYQSLEYSAARIKAAGFDGYYDFEADPTNPSGVAIFDPKQIKSVYNTGTWDPTNPDIRYAPSTYNDKAQVVNIGLNVNDGSTITANEAVDVMRRLGVKVFATEVKQSATEPTLVAVISGMTPEIAHATSTELKQEAIALMDMKTGQGSLHGPQHQKWGEFNPEFFQKPSPFGRVDPAVGKSKRANLPQSDRDSVGIALPLGNKDMHAFLRTAVRKLTDLPGMRDIRGNLEERVDQVVNRIKDNLLFIYDRTSEESRRNWREWYPIARDMTIRWSNEFGHHSDVVAAVNARLSPQKNWNENVTLTRRVLEAVRDNPAWTEEHRDFVLDTLKPDDPRIAEVNALKPGTRLSEMNDQQAAWLARAENEIHGDTKVYDHNMVHQTDASKVRWQSYDAVASAVHILRNPTLDVISEELGGNHKVRNFYNNHVDPDHPMDVTIDTHAVAAGTLSPFGSADVAVNDAFGGVSHAASGYNGTYFIYAEAYRRAAAERGELPRAMQSVTWEAIRGALSPSQKKNAKDIVANIHDAADAGEITHERARELVWQTFQELTSGRGRSKLSPEIKEYAE